MDILEYFQFLLLKAYKRDDDDDDDSGKAEDDGDDDDGGGYSELNFPCAFFRIDAFGARVCANILGI